MAALAIMESSSIGHLDADTLAAYIDGRLAHAELGRADRHIDSCRSCRLELSTLAAIHTQPVLPQGEAPEGTLGRYHVLRELGRGSMGIVLRAYDPELARPVAIKLVRDVDADTRELLRREARALAKLRHPNVVTVYDVIVESDALYVAMELIEGDTLRGHCRGRPAREIVASCIRAGRGLAAAHDAGVIHRDFKPENVLCGEHGEVKVSDFGLARAADETPDGALAGTPAYMAPEVLRREPATAASDQYSYCVTVWELLTGERPTGGAPKASTTFTPIPAWIIRVLRRGLERDPAARFPSMHALVDALADDPQMRRRRRVLLAAGALVAVASGALIVKLGAPDGGSQCAIDPSALGDAWTQEHKQQITQAITAASDADTATRVVAALDDRARRWVDERRDACVATHERGEQSATALGRRVACLDRQRRELGELARVLGSADDKLAGIALEAVARLRDPEACATADDVLPDVPAARVLVEHGRTILARAYALQYAGRGDEADRLAGQLLEQVGDTAPRLRAEALFVRARIDVDRGQHDRAEDHLFEALQAAERGHDDGLVATIWVEIVATTGAQKHRFDLALSNARAADAVLARIEPGPELQLRYSYALGTLLHSHGKLAEARTRLEAGLAIASDDPRRQAQLGLIEIALCDVERQLGNLPIARERCATGMQRLETALGPNHIRVAVSLSISGALEYTERKLDAAERIYRRAIAIFEQRDAREHVAYALALSNIGAVYSERDDAAEAVSYYERALAMFDAHHPAHPQRLMPLQGLAAQALRAGETARAIAYYTQIRDARAATYAPEHPMRLVGDYNLALAYRANRQLADATRVLEDLTSRALAPGKESWILAGRALDLAASLAADQRDHVRALALRQRALAAISRGPDAVERAYVERHLGETLLYLKRPADAIGPVESALAVVEKHGDSYDMGTARYVLARALWESGRDRVRSRQLAALAAADLAKAQSGDGLGAYRKNVATFLRVNR